nr:hypothetical protein [Natrinema limicola]
MEIENDRYADLTDGQSTTFEEGVRQILGTLVDYEDTVTAHEDRFLPSVLTDNENDDTVVEFEDSSSAKPVQSSTSAEDE